MQRAGSSRSWPVLVTGLGTLVVVAVAGRWLTRSDLADPAVASASTRLVDDAVRFVFAGVFAVGALCLVLAAAGGSLFGADPATGARRRLTVGWVATVMGVVFVALLALWWLSRRHPAPVAADRLRLGAPGAGHAADRAANNGDWWFVLGALVLVALAAGGWAWTRHREARPRRDVPDPGGPDELMVPAGDADPEAEHDPRRAVVAAYHRLLVLLHRHGSGRRQSEAPFEHLDRVLGDRPDCRVPARALTAVFERARYSDHPVTSEDRDRVLSELRSFAAALDRVPVEGSRP